MGENQGEKQGAILGETCSATLGEKLHATLVIIIDAKIGAKPTKIKKLNYVVNMVLLW